MRLIIEYVLCYSAAFFLGVSCGFLAAIGLRRRPSKSALWRRNHERKSIH